MRAINLFRGSRAVQRAKLPLARAQANEADPGSANDAASEVGLRFLNGLETAEVLSKAREFAVKRGVSDPREEDELYQYGKAVWTVLLGCVDAENYSVLFFDSEEQVLALLSRDELLLLAELQ